MYKVSAWFAVIFLLFGITGCDSETKPLSIGDHKTTQDIPKSVTHVKVQATMDVGEIYDSVEKLTQEANIVVQGVVQNHEFFQREEVARTKSTVKVTKVISGTVAVGDIVTFVELGGMRTKGDIAKSKPDKIRITSGHENDPVPVIYNGVPSMRTGEEYLLFGRLSSSKILLPQSYYTCVGAFQGKFQLDGKKAKRLTDRMHGVDREAFPTLEMPLSHLTTKVQAVKH
ncbi:cytochrome c-type biogenesis protein CcmE [Croceifilum oryzae]|uniref:Cytochrome c-type biogenesis protein CcmE n=1 Tax=Croceifilum oryzae TaxID=1553429 RepID=A0AAJ1WTN4_9BACL|nr:hypothetical protein [Croceifilum oryzae]MDQ0417176.1 cytochrome c-type biogenesis protein CcmE [Croceifilum oryzae]